MNTADILVIGGGVIGAAVAYGLTERGAQVTLLDQGGSAPNASRGNFGLVWVQGKGLGMPRYAQWTLEAAQTWPKFSADLLEETGIDVDYQQPGGFEVCLGEEEFSLRKAELEQLRQETANCVANSVGIDKCEMLNSRNMQELIPEMRLGDFVSGASFSTLDGHLNPLLLLSALTAAIKKSGTSYYPDQQVESISFRNDCFDVQTTTERFSAKKVVLACGLGIKTLASQIGLEIPIHPQRGQILVTERTLPLLAQPFVTLRQTVEGSFMIGASHEDVGLDCGTTLDEIRRLARHAVQVFPELSKLQMVRCWGALRILTPDSKPIYVESENCPGAFVVTSHSGITLAPLHASRISHWIAEGTTPEGFEQFHSRRFDA
ncbi:MAG: FAD-binding oxidoreductase [SAR324 cluster bacterium]|jgi:glycine/D-amino acid oxidase-like deaminating enzyme|nr:FAD-binding oxidoreductase [SAR324 cluster bacterium]MCH2267373.1 FAD-binding oxidoreductase [SAR324 cluster bacterium]